MKKILLIVMLFTAAITGGFAQTTITNGNMETWVNVGSATEEPTQWNSNKTGGGNATLGPQTCFRDAPGANNTSYCARVRTAKVAVIGTIVNGSLTTGKVEAPTTNKAD